MLILSAELEQIIRDEGEKAYPNECCGVLIGEINNAGHKIAKRANAIVNAREDGEQYHRFLITPEDMMNAERSARAAKLDVIGFYHSHPDHPAAPSQYDHEHALPCYSYVIVAIEKGNSQALTSWELSADRTEFVREEVTGSFSLLC